MRVETAPPEVETVPKAPNLLHVFADHHGNMGAIEDNLMGLTAWCPRQDLFTRTDLGPDELTKINDWVVKIANESGWENIPEEYESLFAESISRQEFEPNISFWSQEQNISWKLELEPSQTARLETADVAQNEAANNKRAEAAANQRSESKVKVHEVNRVILDPALANKPEKVRTKDYEYITTANRKLPPGSVQAIMTQFAQTKVTHKVEISIAPDAKKSVKDNKNNVTNKPQLKPMQMHPPKVIKTQATINKLSQPKTIEAKPALVKTVAPKPPMKYEVLAAPPMSVKIRDQPEPVVTVEKVVKPVVAKKESLAVFQEHAPTEVTDTNNVFEEAVEVQFADTPQTTGAQKLENLFDNLNTSRATLEPDPFSQAFEIDKEPLPFSEKLEQFVVQEVAAAERALAMQAISDIKELILVMVTTEPLVSDKLAEIVGLVDVDEAFSELAIVELAAELPISKEVQVAVIEMLQMLGLPEPTDRQIKQCIVKLRIEALSAQLELAKAGQLEDILHEKSRRPSVRDFVSVLASPDFHQLLGRLAVYRPAFSARVE